MKRCVLFLLAAAWAGLAFAADNANPSVMFYKGNAYYEQAKYDEAIAEYRNALAAGYESGNIYYNLGNAYFKKGELGRAIVNYKRAQRFIPQDVDLKANTEYAQSAAEQTVAQKTNIFMRILDKATETLSPDALAGLSVVSYSLVFLLAITLLFVKNMHRYARLPLLVCCVIFILAAAGLYVKIDRINQPWAVMLDKETDVKYEPFDSATGYFKLFQGQEVLLVKTKGEWAFIKRPDGKFGWLKAAGVEKI